MPNRRRMPFADPCRTITERLRDPLQDVDGPRDDRGDPLGVRKRQGLRHELPDHEPDVGQDREGEDERQSRREVRLEVLGDERLADRTEQDPREA